MIRVSQARGWARPCHRPSPKYWVPSGHRAVKSHRTIQSWPGYKPADPRVFAATAELLRRCREPGDVMRTWRNWLQNVLFPAPTPGRALKLLHPPSLPFLLPLHPGCGLVTVVTALSLYLHYIWIDGSFSFTLEWCWETLSAVIH